MSVGKIELAAIIKTHLPQADTDAAIAAGADIARAVQKAESHDLRHARYMRKQLGQQLGKAGETIHRLRADIALIRAGKSTASAWAARDRLIDEAVVKAVPATTAEVKV